MSNLIDLLPPYERRSNVFREIMQAEEAQFANLNASISELEQQLSIDTATWGLAIYEKELGLKTNLSKPLAERRSVVKSKWRGTGKVDRALIKAVVDAFTNGQVEVEFDGSINIQFTGVHGIPPNLDDAKQAAENIAPAHLRVAYFFAYLLIRDIHGVKTLVEMEQTPLHKFAGGEK